MNYKRIFSITLLAFLLSIFAFAEVQNIQQTPAQNGTVSNGTYIGDGTDNRSIAHSLGINPKYITITEQTGGDNPSFQINPVVFQSATGNVCDVLATNTTYFHVRSACNNLNGLTYSWVAIAGSLNTTNNETDPIAMANISANFANWNAGGVTNETVNPVNMKADNLTSGKIPYQRLNVTACNPANEASTFNILTWNFDCISVTNPAETDPIAMAAMPAKADRVFVNDTFALQDANNSRSQVVDDWQNETKVNKSGDTITGALIISGWLNDSSGNRFLTNATINCGANVICTKEANGTFSISSMNGTNGVNGTTWISMAAYQIPNRMVNTVYQNSDSPRRITINVNGAPLAECKILVGDNNPPTQIVYYDTETIAWLAPASFLVLANQYYEYQAVSGECDYVVWVEWQSSPLNGTIYNYNNSIDNLEKNSTYVNDTLNQKVNKSGDTVTGLLNISFVTPGNIVAQKIMHPSAPFPMIVMAGARNNFLLNNNWNESNQKDNVSFPTMAFGLFPNPTSGNPFFAVYEQDASGNKLSCPPAADDGCVMRIENNTNTTFWGNVSVSQSISANIVNSSKTIINGSEVIIPTGSPDGTKFLRDDYIWTNPPGGSGAPTTSHYLIDEADSTLTNATVIPYPHISVNEEWIRKITNEYITYGTEAVVLDHNLFGTHSFTSAVAANSWTGFSIGDTANTTNMFYNVSLLRELRFGINLVNVSGVAFTVGMFNTSVNLSIANTYSGVFFNYTNYSKNATKNPTWNASACSGGKCTTVNTTVAVVNDTYVEVRISGTGGNFYRFYINETQVANITTNLPIGMNHTAIIGALAVNVNATTTPKSIEIDWVYYKALRP